MGYQGQRLKSLLTEHSGTLVVSLSLRCCLMIHRLFMGDRPDENTKEFSMEELNVLNVEKLRKYLKNRGVVITSDTRKRDLMSKVLHASRLHFPLCSTKEQDAAEIASRRKKKLFVDGISLPSP